MLKQGAKFLLNPIRRYLNFRELPELARHWHREDSLGLPERDPGIEEVVKANISWLYTAQEQSPDRDGGVARHYSLIHGWGHSYPETTGYIIPTLLEWHRRSGDEQAFRRARRMLDWLCSIQFSEGGFQGGTIEVKPKVPVTFNTGQILLGLAAGANEIDEKYLDPMHRAASWLRDSQDSDGAWRKHPTPYAKSGDKTYETHVSWGLIEADRVAPGNGYADAALRNIFWALTNQQQNGWFSSNCLDDPGRPLTHTIGYALRGILEGWKYSGEKKFFRAACKTADGLIGAVGYDGKLAGRLDKNWNAAVDWVCLTGTSQIAHCLFMIFQETGDEKYFRSAKLLNQYVRRTVVLDSREGIYGGIRGSFPVSGAYGHYEFLNWAAKFTIDANLLEADIDEGLVRQI